MAWYIIVNLTIMSLGIVAGAFRFKLLPPSVRYFFALLCISWLTEVINWYIGKRYDSNLIVSHFFIVIQFVLIALAYKQELSRYKRWIQLSMIIIFCVSLINTALHYKTVFTEYPSAVRTCSNLFIMSWSLIYLYSLLDMNTAKQGSFTQYSLFWISLGWLLFIGTTFFSLGAFNVVNTSSSDLKDLFKYLRIAANFALYTLFLIAFTSEQKTLSVRGYAEESE